jgi:replicative DNA helicase
MSDVKKLMASIEMPVDQVTEKLVLGTLTSWPEGLSGKSDLIGMVSDILNDQCFTDPLNKEIFKSVMALHSDGEKIDIITLKEAATQANIGIYTPKEIVLRIMDLQMGLSPMVEIPAMMGRAKLLYEYHMRRMMISVFANEIRVLTEFGDPFKTQERVEAIMDEIVPKASSGKVVRMRDAAQIKMQNIDLAKQGVKRFFVFPWPEMERYTVVEGNQVVIGARPGDGKTTMGVELAKAADKQGIPTLYITNEMLPEELAGRDMGVWANVSPYAMDRGDVSLEQMQRMADYSTGAYRTWCASRATSMRALREAIREFKRMLNIQKGDLWCLVFDYIQQVESGKNATRNYAIEEFSRATKEMALSDSHFNIIIAQLKRPGEKTAKRVTMADLKDSGSIEQDADMIFLLTNPYEAGEPTFADGTSTKGVMEIIAAKGRKGKFNDDIRLGFVDGKIFSLAEEPLRLPKIVPVDDYYRQGGEFPVEDL